MGVERETIQKRETPARFRLPIEVNLRANFSAIEVRGEDNLKKIPPGAKVIFATTHISDLDVGMPIAKLGKQFRMKLVNASLQHDITQDPASNLGMRAMGSENMIPVDIQWGREHPVAGKTYQGSMFNPENFIPMKKALEEGVALVIAAYTPTHVKDGKLPSKGGYGAVYAAEISNAVIVPIAIHIKSKDPETATRMSPMKSFRTRPEAEMIIGEPYSPEKIEGIEHAQDILQERKEGLPLITAGLKRESDILMLKLASLLPEEKRGTWQKKLE